MTVPLVVLAVAAVVIVWVSRVTDDVRKHRMAHWALAGLGVLAALLVLAPVVVDRPAVPVMLITVLVASNLVLITIWLVSDVPGSPAERWAEAHGLTLVDVNRQFVRRYVSEGHRLRLVCGLGGAIAIAALGRGFGITTPVSGWVWLMAGYLGGVVWSEAWLTRLPAGTQRTASLTPRRVRDYLAGRLLIAQFVVPVLSVGIGLYAQIASATPPSDAVLQDPMGTSRSTVLIIGGAAIIVALGVTWLQRHIVAKPQPDGAADLLAADDAVRASSVHLLSGTGLGIMIVGIATQCSLLGDIGLIGMGTAGLSSLVAWIAALVAWRYYGHRAWIVRRPASRRTPDRFLDGARA